MTQADDKKSEPLPFLPADSPVLVTGLPDAAPAEIAATHEPLRFPVVAVGASAGGVEALQRLFKLLPATRDIAYIVVVHLAPDRTSHLADILAKVTPMPVVQVKGTLPVEPNRVYVIPPATI